MVLVFSPVLAELDVMVSSLLFSFAVLTVADPVPEMVGLFLLLYFTLTFTLGDPRLLMVVSLSPTRVNNHGKNEPTEKIVSNDGGVLLTDYLRTERM